MFADGYTTNVLNGDGALLPILGTGAKEAAQGQRFGEGGGALRDLSAIELGAIAARAALERSRVAPVHPPEH